MAVNRNKPDQWKSDIAQSVDLYNDWFLRFAPKTFRAERKRATVDVEAMLKRTRYLRSVTPEQLKRQPAMLPALRMSTAPPLARDRLVGLAYVPKSLVVGMERDHRLPPQMSEVQAERYLQKIADILMRLADEDIFPWLREARNPTKRETFRAATIVADRLCGANADPIVRNAQEQRQLDKVKKWLTARGYSDHSRKTRLDELAPGEFAYRLNAPGLREDGENVNIPVDAVVMPLTSKAGELPLMIEAKSAGDFTNTNKRRKEEAAKVGQLRRKYGSGVRYVLFLCGYFDTAYLGYEAAEGIDWVWEHRMDDLKAFGL